MNKLYLLFSIVFLLSIGYAEGVACGSNQTTFINGCTIDSSLTLNGLPFYINTTSIAIAVGGTTGNLIVNCNNSPIIGNGSSTFFKTSSKGNITFTNCNVSGYDTPFWISTENSTLLNSLIFNSNYGVQIRGGGRITISNVTIRDLAGATKRGVSVSSSTANTNINLTGLTIQNTSVGVYLEGSGSLTTIENSNIINPTTTGIRIAAYDKVTIRNNNLSANVDSIEGVQIQSPVNDTSITGNRFNNISLGVWLESNGHNYTINNNYFINSIAGYNIDTWAIVSKTSSGVSVSNITAVGNTIIYPLLNSSGSSAGIKVYAISDGHHNFSYNNITGFKNGIIIDGTHNYTQIIGNRIINVTFYGISADADSRYYTISNNYVSGTGRNGIMTLGDYNTLENNYVQDYSHSGIDSHTDLTTETLGTYTIINNNTLNHSGDLAYAYIDTTAIYMSATGYNNVTNNKAYNSWNISVQSPCLGIDGANYSVGNYFANNYCENMYGYAIYDAGSDNTYFNNTWHNVTQDIRRLTLSAYNYVNTSNVFFHYNDNLDTDVTSYYDSSGNTTTTIESNGRFNISVGTTLSPSYWYIINQLSQYPYNDIKNTSNGVILASNVDNFTITLSPNQQIEVGDFTGGQCSIGTNTRTGLLCIIGGCN